MVKIKFIKFVVDVVKFQVQVVELWDIVVFGFLCKIILVGCKVFMFQYCMNVGECCKLVLGLYGELIVEQVCVMVQEWLVEVCWGGDFSVVKVVVCKVLIMKEYCIIFMEDYFKQCNKFSIQCGYQGVIDCCIILIMGWMKVQDVKCLDVVVLMKKLVYKLVEVNCIFGVLCKMFNLVEVWGLCFDGMNLCCYVLMFLFGKEIWFIVDDELVWIFCQLGMLEVEGLENYVILLVICL